MKPEIRKDYVEEEYVIIAPKRGKRPKDTKKKIKSDLKVNEVCVFCKEKQKNIKAELQYGKDDWRVKVIKNKYPAISLDNKDAYGTQEVVIESPAHNCMLHEQKEERVAEILKAYSDRTKALSENKKKPDKKSDHFVGDYYVMFSKKANDSLNKEAQELLIKWESNDKSTLSLWNKMNKWALTGFDQTYKRLNIKFHKTYYESDYFDKGKNIVNKGLKKKIFDKDEEDNVMADLSEYNLPNRILLRKDKTSVYITQDLALAELKLKDYNPDLSIYVVASEQNLHFKQLFAILDKLKSKISDKCHHLSYGMVLLPEGRMKSREGKVVDADTLLDEVVNLAEDELKSRKRKITEQKKSQIGIGALKFYLIKIDPIKDIVYDPKESISFTGDTAPYVQYAHARICSIIKKTKTPKKPKKTKKTKKPKKPKIPKKPKTPKKNQKN